MSPEKDNKYIWSQLFIPFQYNKAIKNTTNKLLVNFNGERQEKEYANLTNNRRSTIKLWKTSELNTESQYYSVF